MIDLAITSHTQYLITGDNDLLSLKKINTGFVIPSSDVVELDFENVFSKMIKCVSTLGEEINDIL